VARKPEVEYRITAEDASGAVLKKAEASISAIAGGAKSFGLAAAAALTGVGVAVKQLADQLDALDRNSKRAGLDVEVFQAWEFAATQAGATAGEFVSAMTRATTAIGQAALGTGPAAKSFERFGISVRDSAGEVRPTEAVLRDYANAIAGLKSPAERAAAATTLFGRGAGPIMANLLKEGADGLQAWEDRAREFGVVVSGEAVAAADDFNDRMDQLKRTVTASLANTIFENAEAIGELADSITRVVVAVTGGAGAFTSFSKWVGEELAARIHGVSGDDIPRLIGALNEAKTTLADLEAGGGLINFAGESVRTQIANTTAEIARLTQQLDAARARALEPPPLLVAPEVAPGPSDRPTLNIPLPAEAARRFEQLLAEEAKFLALERELRVRGAQELGAAIESEAAVLREEELARALGFESFAAQELALRDQELWAVRLEARRLQMDEELAAELGFKSARNMELELSEEAHQQRLIDIRVKGFGQYQSLAKNYLTWDKKTSTERTAFVLDQAAMLTAGLAQESKAAFYLNKAAAIANAIVNTAQGVTAALALGPPGIPLAGIIKAFGAVQIATIAATAFAGGGGGGGGSVAIGRGSSGGIPSAANEMFTAPTVKDEERNNSTIRLEISADDSDIARTIMKHVRVIADDEDDILASSGSRQAVELVR